MTKFVLMALIAAGLLSACATLTPKPPPLSEFVRPLSSTLLTIKIPARNADATLVLVARNQGVETWQTVDNVTVSTQNGVIVATRGLGFDVMGSDVRQTLTALAGRQAGQYVVKRRYLTADNHSESVSATCTMSRSSQGLHIEDCQAAGVAFRNEYALDGSGRIARSKQWIGPDVQYLGTAYASAN
jgi:hypothetical protein